MIRSYILVPKANDLRFRSTMMDSLTNSDRQSAGEFAVRLFHAVLVVFSLVVGLASGLIYLLPVFRSADGVGLPWAFWVSSGFLVVSSVMQHQAVQAVKWERQPKFRSRLFYALLAGMGFAATQAYGLWCLWQNQPKTAEAASTGPEGFVFVLAVLHGLHVSVAIMFLTFVYLKSRMDRYDHEYYWGVTFCGWFWHALGIVWMAIIFVFLIAT